MARTIVKGLWVAIVLGIALLMLANGCSKGQDAASTAEKKYITIKGSDTMVHLVSSWAEAFMQAHPQREVSVTGGGSGTGIAALLNGTTDICAASRQMEQQEKALAEQKGLQPQEIIVGRDGIAVIVNPANPISEATLDQLAKVFTGGYTRWSQLGGSDEEIIVLSRESSSGTYVFFQEHVLKKQDYTVTARLLPATSAIIQAVANDKWSIGYVGLGYALGAGDKVKMLAIKVDEAAKAILPSLETVKSGEYSIARPLYFYSAGEPQGTVKEFIDFCLGPEGQKIVLQAGYVPID